MSKYILPVAVVLALTAVASLAPFAYADRGPGNGGANETRVEGTITAVNVTAGSVVITTQGGTAITVPTIAATKIERNGVRVTLAAFKVGDRGQARITNGVATKLEAVGP